MSSSDDAADNRRGRRAARGRGRLCGRDRGGAVAEQAEPGHGHGDSDDALSRTGEEVTHFLHVFPHVAFAIGTAQEKGGMERRE